MKEEIKRIEKIKDEKEKKKEVGMLIGAMLMSQYGMKDGFKIFKETIEPEIDKE